MAMSRQKSRWVLRTCFLLVAVYCFHAVMPEIRAHKKFREVAVWPVTSAKVQSATPYWKRSSWGSNRFCAKLSYTYSANGRTYEGTNSIFDFGCHPDGYDVAAAHPSGSSLQVAFDPSDPTVTVVPGTITDPGYPWADILAGSFFLMIVVSDFLRSVNADSEDTLEDAESEEPEDTRILPGL